MKRTLIGAALLLPSLVFANDSYPYIGLSYSFIDTKVSVDSFGSDSFDNQMLGGIVGYQFNPYIALEARGYGNVKDYEVNDVSVEINSDFSVLAKPMYPINRYFTVYALAGYGIVKGAIGDYDESEGGFQYGAGVSFSNNRAPLMFQVEWAQRFDDSFGLPGVNFKGQGVTANIIYNFNSKGAL